MSLSNTGNDLPLIAVSNGSAFTSVSIDPSQVETVMCLNEVAAFSSIRFLVWKYNTKKEIDIVFDAGGKVVRNLKAMVI